VARQNRHHRAIHRLNRQLVVSVRFKAAEVAWRVKGEHLTTSVRREIHRAEEAADDAKVVLRRIACANDLLSRSERNDSSVEMRNTRRRQFTDRQQAFAMMAIPSETSTPH